MAKKPENSSANRPAGSIWTRIAQNDRMENWLITAGTAAATYLATKVTGAVEQDPHKRRGDLVILLLEMGVDAQHIWERRAQAKRANWENDMTTMLCMVAFPEHQEGSPPEKPDEQKKRLKILNESAANDDTWTATIEVLKNDMRAEKLRRLAGHVSDHVTKLVPSAETRSAVIDAGNQFAAWLDGVTDRHRR